MKLNPTLAQSIVDHMMNQIPYNINIMNEHGYIIASGNPHRINTLHVGAVDAINQGKTLPMGQGHGSHGQPGVNMPITYEGKIIGVVGITGDPDKVVPLASLLKTAVELLLRQEALDQEKRENEKSRQRFLYRLLESTRTLAPSANLIAEGKRFGIDLTIPRYVVAVKCRPQELDGLNNDPQNLTFTLGHNIGLIIIHDSLILRQLIKQLQKQQKVLGIGEASTLVGRVAIQAITTLRIQASFADPTLIYYHQVRFFDALLKGHLPVKPVVDKFNQLAKTDRGSELITTIREFVRCNLNINQTAKHLFTHRNTVNYRLERVAKEFKLDPKKATDLFELFTGYVYFVSQDLPDNANFFFN